jgi:hypothetical protein
MAEHEQIEVHIRSNVDALSADRIHQALVQMVQRNVEESTEFLRAIEPKRTGELEAHTSHTDAIEDIAGQIEAKIGITSIENAPDTNAVARNMHPGAQDTDQYPLFVDRGTGVFGPTGSPIFARDPKGMMVFEGREGTVFTHVVKGQHGQHFMAATAAFAEEIMRSDQHIRLALVECAAEAAAMLAEELA